MIEVQTPFVDVNRVEVLLKPYKAQENEIAKDSGKDLEVSS